MLEWSLKSRLAEFPQEEVWNTSDKMMPRISPSALTLAVGLLVKIPGLEGLGSVIVLAPAVLAF